jgi:hypothetical protein
LYWASYLLLKFFGVSFFVSMFVALVCFAIGCFMFGLIRALDESRKAGSTLTSGWQPAAVPAPPSPPQFPASWNAQPGLPPITAATVDSATNPFVGNLVLGIFHLENCHWVDTISQKNRVGFPSAAEARAHGFKPCRICSPAT